MAWEARLEAWHDDYRRNRLAYVIKCNPPIKLLSSPVKGRFRACFVGTGPPDYMGLADGRPVAFDAKDCTRARWPLADLARHQALDLEAHRKQGGVSAVALRLRGAGWWLPWEALHPLWWAVRRGEAVRGDASLSVDDCERLGRPIGSEGWLPCL